MSGEENNTVKTGKNEKNPYITVISFSAANFVVFAMVYYEIFDMDIQTGFWMSGGFLIASVIGYFIAKKKA